MKPPIASRFYGAGYYVRHICSHFVLDRYIKYLVGTNKEQRENTVSVSHLIILGIFIALGSAGLAMVQSSLGVIWRSVAWRSSKPAENHGAINGKLTKSCTMSLGTDTNIMI